LNDLHARQARKIMKKRLRKMLMKRIEEAAKIGYEYLYMRHLPEYARDHLMGLGYKVEESMDGWKIKWI
jgi:hypothetical protein